MSIPNTYQNIYFNTNFSLQARELGDFVPLQDNGPGSRLIREDDADDDEDGRIQVRGLDLPSDKPKREFVYVVL